MRFEALCEVYLRGYIAHISTRSSKKGEKRVLHTASRGIMDQTNGKNINSRFESRTKAEQFIFYCTTVYSR